ncbi:DUF2339 domain-containing protein [Sphingomonas hengshuiensis]|nr:DUF2339 domain-containing protein [Sphingomonas hengshuiensis]
MAPPLRAAPPRLREAPPPAAAPAPLPEPLPEPAADSAPRAGFESLVGGRLPIWIGGVALVLAGFFLVRYSIENGLLGPAARTLLAALFGAALVAASEAARRAPQTRDDPRVAQALAGAGVASLYATLYLAAALYHLIAPGAAFVAMLAVTAAALGLSLRHGPPTAAMALVGGFVAPLIAGFDAAGIGPLLVYLTLFLAALFGLAIRRGWGWLALAACVAGFGWINFLAVALGGVPGDLPAVGAFTMLLAAGASAAFAATGIASRWLRIAPLVAGLVQLVALAPALDFSPLAWGFYLVLAAATLALTARQPTYAPASLAALALLLVLEGLALVQPDRGFAPVAAGIATLLFALPGHGWALRERHWAALAAAGTSGPLLVAHAAAPDLLAAWNWGMLELAAAAACGHLAWRLHRAAQPAMQPAATLAAGLLAAVGLAQFVPVSWLALPLTVVLVGLALWARVARVPALFVLPALPFVAALIAAALPIAGFAELLFASATGDRLPFAHLPAAATLLQSLALPVAALLATLLDPRQLGRAREWLGGTAITLGLLLVYALAKQPLAIDTLPRFVAWGFVERALLTQACLAAGWLMLKRQRLPRLGGVLLMLGLCRFVWFDLVLFNPALVAQSVGPLPLINAAFLHAALAAFWLWSLAPARGFRAAAALFTLVAALVAVRQATHGDLLTGPVSTGENGGYSAILLGVSGFWLWRGIAARHHDLRLAGLGLLTVVTCKVFLIDAAALDGLLRILSFLGLGVALIAIGWGYGRFLGSPAPAAPESDAAT